MRRRWLMLLLLLVGLLLGGRWAWVVTTSLSGWRTQRDQWTGLARILVGLERRSLEDRDPQEQAEFWLAEVERVAATTGDPQIARGAAWMLDAPEWGFMQRHTRLVPTPGLEIGPIPGYMPEQDDQEIAQQAAEFESQCHSVCLAQIQRATELDPTDPEVWRSRAWLSFEPGTFGLELRPRDLEWKAILDRCQQADPGNALYDYLAALQLWNSSASYSWKPDGYVLEIQDQKTFDEGTQRLAAGLTKPHLQFDSQAHLTTASFLKQTSLSRPDQMRAAVSRLVDNRMSGLCVPLLRWQSVRLDLEKRAGRLAEAKVLAQQMLDISQQLSVTNQSSVGMPMALVQRGWSLATLKDLHREHPGLLSLPEAEAVSSRLTENRVEQRILQEVTQRYEANSVLPDSKANRMLIVTLQAAFQMRFLAALGWTLILAAANCLLRRRDESTEPVLSLSRHAVIWIGTLCLSGLLLFLLPTRLDSKIRESGISAEEYRRLAQLEDAHGAWAVLQWHAYRGPLVVPTFAVVLLVVWGWLKQRRESPVGGTPTSWTDRLSQSGRACRSARNSCIVVGYLCLLGYWALAPELIALQEQAIHRKATWIMHSDGAIPEVEQITAQVRADAALMTRLRQEVELENDN